MMVGGCGDFVKIEMLLLCTVPINLSCITSQIVASLKKCRL